MKKKIRLTTEQKNLVEANLSIVYWIICHSADYLEPFSSLYLKVLLDSNSVMARLNGGYPAK